MEKHSFATLYYRMRRVMYNSEKIDSAEIKQAIKACY